MKICAACTQSLPKEKFSKKQWQLKQSQRRCKDCIADNREVNLEALNDDVQEAPIDALPPLSSNVGVGASPFSEEDLFKSPPPRDECPICMLPLSIEHSRVRYQSCCGKEICIGCVRTAAGTESDRCLCPFCQMPAPTSERERIQRVKKRARANDPSAIYFLGCLYAAGEDGLPKNFSKAMEFWLRAGDLGCAEAYCHAGAAYFNRLGVERDMKKARYYYGLAAMGGDAEARHNLGCFEEEMGNMKKAIEHWMIAAQSGFDLSLSAIREAYVNSHVTKDDFEKALRAHKESAERIKK